MKTLNNVELQDPKDAIPFDEIMDYLKEFAVKYENKDFIFITGIYRIEFHNSPKTFVVEQRHFDHFKIEDDEQE